MAVEADSHIRSTNHWRGVRISRFASIGIVIAVTWLWLFRTTGTLEPPSALLVATCILGSMSFGRWLMGYVQKFITRSPGVAFEFVLGFLFGNTVLFVLTLVSPFGIAVNLGCVGVIALLAALARIPPPASGADLAPELGSLATIAFAALAATIWVGDQQPLRHVEAGTTVFTVWGDVFIHARLISAFAQSHGLGTLSDIKLGSVGAAAYHFASYMVPASLDALTNITAIDAYAAFQLPFGILLLGLAAYVLPAVAFRTTWPAVMASVAVLAIPDSYQQGFGLRYLSFHFMSQANLGMLYGIACIAMAWAFMIDGCRRGRILGIAVAFTLLGVCIVYKAHLFVANALILMVYPCIFFRFKNRRIGIGWRVVTIAVLISIFVAVIMLSQQSPRVPTIRLDGSGLARYIVLLVRGARDGPVRSLVEWLLFRHHYPRIVQGMVAGIVITVCSFGWWTLLAPWTLWKTRYVTDRAVVAFVVIVVVNYLVMTLGLALDEHAVGAPEEFVNRPHAWAYFVMVAFVTTACAEWCLRTKLASFVRPLRWWAVPAAGVLLVGIHLEASNLQTFPEWNGFASYRDFNGAPTCLVQSAEFIRDHAATNDLLQDSAFDPSLMFTALAERQGYVANQAFGGHPEEVRKRMETLQAIKASGDSEALVAWAAKNHVNWYVVHPDDGRWKGAALDNRTAYRCDRFEVIRFGR